MNKEEEKTTILKDIDNLINEYKKEGELTIKEFMEIKKKSHSYEELENIKLETENIFKRTEKQKFKKGHVLTVRISEDEKNLIDKMKKEGVQISDFIREILVEFNAEMYLSVREEKFKEDYFLLKYLEEQISFLVIKLSKNNIEFLTTKNLVERYVIKDKISYYRSEINYIKKRLKVDSTAFLKAERKLKKVYNFSSSYYNLYANEFLNPDQKILLEKIKKLKGISDSKIEDN